MSDNGGHASSVPPPVVAVATSAGGVTALQAVLSMLPAEFDGVILIVLHLGREHPSMLPQILQRKTTLRVKTAEDGETVERGTIYVAGPDQHLLLNADGTISLTHTELVHFVRPSADLLFESVAAAAGEYALGIILTGTGTDGALGASAIKKRGGRVIAQDEATSEYFGMPGSAIAQGSADRVLPLDEIAGAMTSFVESLSA